MTPHSPTYFNTHQWTKLNGQDKGNTVRVELEMLITFPKQEDKAILREETVITEVSKSKVWWALVIKVLPLEESDLLSIITKKTMTEN